MKTLIFSFLMIAFSAFTLNAQNFTVDVTKSTLKWHGEKVTGEHFGLLNLKAGSMQMKNNQIAGGEFVIDMNSITCTDLTDATYNAKLVNHLKSDDFFGVAKHPEAMIVIVKSAPFLNNEATVEANLTIKNITQPVTFKVKQDGKAYLADLVVDRSKFNVRYGSGSFFDNLGDNMIYDEFKMSVRIEAIAEKEIDS
jgi:polyisoprenoid-binding protein YceI